MPTQLPAPSHGWSCGQSRLHSIPARLGNAGFRGLSQTLRQPCRRLSRTCVLLRCQADDSSPGSSRPGEGEQPGRSDAAPPQQPRSPAPLSLAPAAAQQVQQGGSGDLNSLAGCVAVNVSAQGLS